MVPVSLYILSIIGRFFPDIISSDFLKQMFDKSHSKNQGKKESGLVQFHDYTHAIKNMHVCVCCLFSVQLFAPYEPPIRLLIP